MPSEAVERDLGYLSGGRVLVVPRGHGRPIANRTLTPDRDARTINGIMQGFRSNTGDLNPVSGCASQLRRDGQVIRQVFIEEYDAIERIVPPRQTIHAAGLIATGKVHASNIISPNLGHRCV
jgi:hypothetical protein